eukprot:g38.t1
MQRRIARADKQERQRRNLAAAQIQAMARRATDRARVQVMARASLIKYIAFESQLPYYISPLTKRKKKKKPLVLGNLDVRRYCRDCEELYCKECYENMHAKGKKTAHTFLAAISCIECDFQVASRVCTTCGDPFCDSCFYSKHKRGRLRQHQWRAIVPMCAQCPLIAQQEEEEKYGAVGINGQNVIRPTRHAETIQSGTTAVDKIFASRWMCETCGGELCTRCARRSDHEGHSMYQLPFQNEQTLRERQEAEDEARRKEEEAARLVREAEEMKRRRESAALFLQVWWRGYLGRAWGKRYLRQQRKEMETLFHQAQVERRRRSTFKYRTKRVALSIVKSPYYVAKFLGPKPLSQEQIDEREAEKAAVRIERRLRVNPFAFKMKFAVLIENDSLIVTLRGEKTWKEISVKAEKGSRTIARRDRLRFHFGKTLLGEGAENEYEKHEYAVERISLTDPKQLILTAAVSDIPADQESLIQSEELDVYLWWMPPITEDEIEQRHKDQEKRRKKLQKEQRRLKKKKERMAMLAENFDEDSAIGKRLIKMSK